jgi:3-dehydroquinate synthase
MSVMLPAPKRVDVALGERSYPILISPRISDWAQALDPALRGHEVLLLSNTTVAPLYAERIEQALGGRHVERLILPDGEAHKTLASASAIFDALVAIKAKRDATLIALGGGVIGDLGGFAAACYMRGIRFVQVPTTLLAMVDSSVGGKTAVNHAAGKNLIGAFHQPSLVLADLSTLQTLPEREYRAGLAEVVKYGAILDGEFLDWIDANATGLNSRDPLALMHAVRLSCQHKAAIVARDERETGERAHLNFGHTFGHAIETLTGYTEFLHGETVAIGMQLAARLSVALGRLSTADAERLERVLVKLHLPIALPRNLGAAAMIETMALDKKARSDGLKFIVLDALGHAAQATASRELLEALLDRP